MRQVWEGGRAAACAASAALAHVHGGLWESWVAEGGASHSSIALLPVRLQNGSGTWGQAAATQYKAAGPAGQLPQWGKSILEQREDTHTALFIQCACRAPVYAAVGTRNNTRIHAHGNAKRPSASIPRWTAACSRCLGHERLSSLASCRAPQHGKGIRCVTHTHTRLILHRQATRRAALPLIRCASPCSHVSAAFPPISSLPFTEH